MQTKYTANYRVFTRRWWRTGTDGQLEPHKGSKKVLHYFHTERGARDFCTQWNTDNRPGKFGVRAEFEAC